MKSFFHIVCLAFAAALLCVGCGRDLSADELLMKAKESAANGNWKKSLSFARNAYDSAPDSPAAIVMYALALENNDQLDEAAARMRRLEENVDSFMAQYTLGRMLFKQGKIDRAIRPLTNALNLRPNDANTLLLLARANSDRKRDDAIEYYKRLSKTERFRDSAIPHNEIGVLCLLNGKRGQAAFELKCALGLDADNPEIVLNNAILNDYHSNTPASGGIAKNYYNRFIDLARNRPELTKDYAAVGNRLNAIR